MIEFSINPHPEAGNLFTSVDNHFQPGFPTSTSNSHAYGRGTLDEDPPHHLYGNLWGVPVRMCILYHGDNQTFQIYKVDMWDEGFHRLFVSEDSADYAIEIRDAFLEQRAQGSDTNFGGWYYDEWYQDEQIRSYVKVNKIIQSATGSEGIATNGHFGWPGCTWCPRNLLFDEMERQDVDIKIHMDEFYFLGGKEACYENLWWSHTFPESDATYFGFESCGGTDVTAEKSLQCAIDQHLWGDSLIIAEYDVPISSDYMTIHTSLLDQVEYVHANDNQFWAMIQGDDDELNDADWIGTCCTIRRPSPNEVKLSVWLSVAADADGILWYPIGFASGLLKWDPDSADNCGREDNLAYQSADVDTTDRYWAAQKVGSDIQRLAPLLDSPQFVFVKTYASRAYENDYPDATHKSTWMDTLATDVTWQFDQTFRAVEDIDAWAPDTTEISGWADDEEENPYVQVTRFRNELIPDNSPDLEDYWFLVVNRRALEDERRKIRLTMQVDTAHKSDPYFVDYILGDTTISASPCALSWEACGWRFVEVVLEPGDAELLHFYRGLLGCDTTYAYIDSLTIRRTASNKVTLKWEEINWTENADTFDVDTYFIYGSRLHDGPFTPIGLSTTTSYVDSVFTTEPKYYYMVQACGTVRTGE